MEINMRLDCNDCEDKASENKKEEGFGKELLESRSIIISEEVSEELAQKVYAQLLVLNERSKRKAITVYINSPGGDADSGFGIYDMMRFIEAPVHTVVCGLCASAAVTIFLGANEGKNFSTPNSRFLLHQPSTGVRGSASDMEITAIEINKTRDRYNQIISDITGKSIDDIAKDADRDFWMSPAEALEYKLVSKIVTSKAEAK